MARISSQDRRIYKSDLQIGTAATDRQSQGLATVSRTGHSRGSIQKTLVREKEVLAHTDSISSLASSPIARVFLRETDENEAERGRRVKRTGRQNRGLYMEATVNHIHVILGGFWRISFARSRCMHPLQKKIRSATLGGIWSPYVVLPFLVRVHQTGSMQETERMASDAYQLRTVQVATGGLTQSGGHREPFCRARL